MVGAGGNGLFFDAFRTIKTTKTIKISPANANREITMILIILLLSGVFVARKVSWDEAATTFSLSDGGGANSGDGENVDGFTRT